jgi:hypothetical protein
MTLSRSILLTLLSVLWFTCACPAAEPGKPVRMLWLGSSSLYFHNQPKVTAEWLTTFGGMPARAEVAGRSGTGVHVYLREGFKAEFGLKPGQTVLQKITEGRYDYVVLQVPAEFINGPEGEEHDKSLDVYCKAIRDSGGTPFFYEMGWGRDEKAEVGRQKIFAAAVRNKVTLFSPCSTAWKRVRQEKPEMELQNPPDTAHPGTLGCYLNLCCFYATFTGKQPPADLPREIRIWHMTPEDKPAASEKAKTTQFDEYDSVLAGWMKAQIVNSKLRPIPDGTAEYLRKVAWEEYQGMQKKLKEAAH